MCYDNTISELNNVIRQESRLLNYQVLGMFLQYIRF